MVNVKLLKEQIISFNYFNYFFGFKYHRQNFSTQYCSNWVQENKIFDKEPGRLPTGGVVGDHLGSIWPRDEQTCTLRLAAM